MKPAGRWVSAGLVGSSLGWCVGTIPVDVEGA